VWTPPGLRPVRLLGRGAFSEVRLCEDDARGILVSLKTAVGRPDGEAARLLREEHRILSTLRHPGLPDVLDLGEADGRVFLTYAHVPGRSVADLAAADRETFDAVAVGLLATLLALHDRGWLHYDVSPRHVLLGDANRWRDVRLIDLSLAGPEGRTLLGSPRSMAPEILLGQPGGPDSDIYAAGLVLVRLALGEPALEGRTHREILEAARSLPERLEPRLVERLGPERAGLVARALRPDRRDREADAYRLLIELGELGAPGVASAVATAVEAAVRSVCEEETDLATSLAAARFEIGSASALAAVVEREPRGTRFRPDRLVAWLAAHGHLLRRERTWILGAFETDWLAEGLDEAEVRRELGLLPPEHREELRLLAFAAELNEPAVAGYVARCRLDALASIESTLLRPDPGTGLPRLDPPAVAVLLRRSSDVDERRRAHARAAEILGRSCEGEMVAAAYHRLCAGRGDSAEIADVLDEISGEGRLRFALPLAAGVRRALEEDTPVCREAILAAARAEAEARDWTRVRWLTDRIEPADAEVAFLDAHAELQSVGRCSWRRGRIEDGGTPAASLARLALESQEQGSAATGVDEILDRAEAIAGIPGGREEAPRSRIVVLGEWAGSGSAFRRSAYLALVGAASRAAYDRGDFGIAREILGGGRQIATTWGMRLRASIFEANFASAVLRQGDRETASVILERVARDRELLGDRRGAVAVWGNLGVLRYDGGDAAGALASWERQEALTRESGESRKLGGIQCRLACARQETGDWAEARSTFEAAVRLSEAFGAESDEILARINLTALHLAAGRVTGAWRELALLEPRVGDRSLPADRRAMLEGMRLRLSLELGEAPWDAPGILERLRRLAGGEEEVVPGLDDEEAAELLLRSARLLDDVPPPEVGPDLRSRFGERSLAALLADLREGEPPWDVWVDAVSPRDPGALDTETVEILTLLAEAAARSEATGRRTPGPLVDDLLRVADRDAFPGLRWRVETAHGLKELRRGRLPEASRALGQALDGVARCYAGLLLDDPAAPWRTPTLRHLAEGVRRLAAEAGVPAGPAAPDPLAESFRLVALASLALGDTGVGREDRERRRLRRILDVTETLNSAEEVEDLLDQIVASVLDLCDAEYAFVVLLDDEGKPDVRSARTSAPTEGNEIRSKVSRTVLERVLDEQRPVLIHNALDEIGLVDKPSVRSLSLRSIMGAPLLHRGQVLGALCVDNRSAAGSFDEQDLRLLEVFAHQAAVALRKGRLIEELEASCRRLAQTREQSIRAATLKNLGLMAGGIAHDFNNLLMSILGNADLTLSILPPGDAADKIREIKKASLRAARLTDQLLAYAGRSRSVQEPVDLRRIVRDVLETVANATPDGVVVDTELGEAPARVRADAVQIRQLVLNLVTNAIEATPGPEGRIRVRTGRCCFGDEDCSDLVEEIPKGEYVMLEIGDSGEGMEDEVRSRALEPFFSTRSEGHGMGLPAVHGIVHAHGGGLAIRSARGEGTKVTVLLPPLEEDAAGPENVETTVTGERHRILLVDDEEFVRGVATEMLDHLGYDVVVAEGGEEALEVFGREGDTIDLVLLDVNMPGLNGPETFLRLRELRPDVRVLLSSGYGEIESSEPFESDALAGFIAKPYQMADLRETLRGILG
jgi:signal transduction histidine kinase